MSNVRASACTFASSCCGLGPAAAAALRVFFTDADRGAGIGAKTSLRYWSSPWYRGTGRGRGCAGQVDYANFCTVARPSLARASSTVSLPLRTRLPSLRLSALRPTAQASTVCAAAGSTAAGTRAPQSGQNAAPATNSA